MSLGPVQPAMHGLSTRMSGARKGHVVEDETQGDKNEQEAQSEDLENKKNDDTDRGKKNASHDAHKILKKAVESEVTKVNIIDETGKKVVPDVSGMVINILT